MRELRRESDEIQLEAALGWERPAPDPEPEEHAPTDDDLSEQAKAVGIHLPATVQQNARDSTLALFRAVDERAAA